MLKGVILNEVELVDNFLENYIFVEGVKKTDIIRLVMRKYYTDSKEEDKVLITKEEMFNRLISDLKKGLREEFIYTKWDKTLKTMIGNFYKNISIHGDKIDLVDIEKIIVGSNEIEKIKKLNDEKLERIAFVLLVYAKIYNSLNSKNDSWVRISPTTICQEADVKLRGIEQYKKLHELYEKKYISMSNMNFKTGIKVNYCDKDAKEGIVITDFNKVVIRYILATNKNLKKCELCYNLIEITSNRIIYCKSCSDKKERENKSVRNEKYYKKRIKTV